MDNISKNWNVEKIFSLEFVSDFEKNLGDFTSNFQSNGPKKMKNVFDIFLDL